MLCPSHTDAYPIYVYLPLLIVFRLTEIYTEAGSSDGGTVSVLHAPRRARLGRYDDCLHCAWVSIPFSFFSAFFVCLFFFPPPPFRTLDQTDASAHRQISFAEETAIRRSPDSLDLAILRGSSAPNFEGGKHSA